MKFQRIGPGPNGGERHINLEEIVVIEEHSNALKLKMSNGETIEISNSSERADIMQNVRRR